MKRWLCLALCLLLGACPGARGEAPKVNRFSVCMGAEPTTLDPQLVHDISHSFYLSALFDGLVRDGENGDVLPAAAESWDISADGLVYTFHLRESTWSDGVPVRADDFVFGFTRLVDPACGATYAYDYGVIVKNGLAVAKGELPPEALGVRAVDDRTFEMTLENPISYALGLLTMPSFFPARRDLAVNGDQGRWSLEPGRLAGNGRMRVERMVLLADIVVGAE